MSAPTPRIMYGSTWGACLRRPACKADLVPANLAQLASSTRMIYERHAEAFDRHRRERLVERAWLERLRTSMPSGSRVLDVGCGAGVPIARWFVEQGYEITGVDFAAPMLERSRARFPDQRWLEADMRTLELGETFGAVIAWDSLFHLTFDEQRSTLPRLMKHVAPGGAFMFTCGPREGAVLGRVEGEAVHHASLSPGEYAAILRGGGLRVEAFVAEDPDCDDHTVCLARRGPAPGLDPVAGSGLTALG